MTASIMSLSLKVNRKYSLPKAVNLKNHDGMIFIFQNSMHYVAPQEMVWLTIKCKEAFS